MGLFQPSVEENRRDQGLQRVDQQRALGTSAALFFALPEAQIPANVQLPRRAYQSSCTHDVGPQLGQVALRVLRKTAIQLLADNESQDGISQELKLFIVPREVRIFLGRCIFRFASKR